MSLSAQRHVILASGGSTPTPVLPSYTIRCKFSSGYTPTMGATQTLVDAQENIWDIYKSYNSHWITLFENNTDLLEVVAANATGVTSMWDTFRKCTNLTSVNLYGTDGVQEVYGLFNGCTNLTAVNLFSTASVFNMFYMFWDCTSLTTIPLFDTSNVSSMASAFRGCVNVQSGALALYQQASTQATPPSNYSDCFKDCGRDAPASAPIHVEMLQIPASWGGLGA